MKKTIGKSKLTIKYIQNNDEQYVVDRFSCECGKFYQTFPALYLHFQRAHKIKISTRVEQEACVVQKHKKTRNFLYFYSQVKKQNEVECYPEIKVQNAYEDFQKSLKDYWERCSSMYLNTMVHNYPFEKHIDQNYGKQVGFMKEFPVNFNMFEQNYQNSYQIQEIYDYNCRLLLGQVLENNRKGCGPLSAEFSQKTSDLDLNERDNEENTQKCEVKVQTQIYQVKEK